MSEKKLTGLLGKTKVAKWLSGQVVKWLCLVMLTFLLTTPYSLLPVLHAEDAEIKLNSNDGSTGFIIQNQLGQEVFRVGSNGGVNIHNPYNSNILSLHDELFVIKSDTAILRTDLMVEINARATANLFIGIDTGTLKTDLDYRAAEIAALNISTAALDTNKLDKAAKAADADLLDGLDSTTFVQSVDFNAIKFDTGTLDTTKFDKTGGYISGNVGIGTPAPVAKLTVKDSGIGLVQIGQMAGDTMYGAIGFSGSLDSSNYVLAAESGKDTILNTQTGRVVDFRTGNISRMILSSSGNLGIGTTTPAVPLHVKGSTNLGTFWLQGTNASLYEQVSIRLSAADANPPYGPVWMIALRGDQDTGNRNDLHVSYYPDNTSGGPWSDALRLKPNGNAIFYGNVGIGTNLPTAKLDVVGNLKIGPGIGARTEFPYLTINTNSSTDQRVGIQMRQGSTNLFEIGTDVNTNNIHNFFISDNMAECRLLISSNGKVGIGTTSPDSKLHLFGAVGSGSDGCLTLETDAAANAKWMLAPNYSTTNSFQILYMADVSNPRLFIKSGGNVGIGTTNPSAKLEVAGQVKISGGSPAAGKVLTSDAGGLATWQSVGGDNLGSHIATTTLNMAGNSIINAGNVGIGTTSPAVKLDITNPTSDNLLRLRTTGVDTNAALNFQNDAQSWQIQVQGSDNDKFYIVDGNVVQARLVIDTSGNVGIGTTAPVVYPGYTTLALNNATNGGVLDFMSNGTLIGEIYNVGNSNFYMKTPSATPIVLATNSTDRVYISSSGNVGIGTTSPQAPLHVYKNIGSADVLRLSTNWAAPGLYTGIEFGDSKPVRIRAYADSGDERSFQIRTYSFGEIEALTIKSAGNVGIGTTNPLEKLSISGNASITNSAGTALSVTQNGTVPGIYLTQNGDHNGLYIESNLSRSAGYFLLHASDNNPLNTSTTMRATNNGNGDVFWAYKAGSGSGDAMRITNNGTGEAISIDNNAKIGADNSSLTFRTLNNDRVTISTMGNVGIGTASPRSNLEIYKPGSTTKALIATGGSANAVLGFKTAGAGDASIGVLDSVSGLVFSGVDSDLTTIHMRITNTGNVGIGTTSPEFRLSLDNDGGLIAKGINGSGATLTTAGAGTRLIWYPKKSAFRVGSVNGTQWNDANIGNYSIAMGSNTTAGGICSIAIGNNATANYESAIAIGSNATASYDGSVAIGQSVTASGEGATAMGAETNASGWGATSMGARTTASFDGATAMGTETNASGESSTAMGAGTIASGMVSTAIGQDAIASGEGSTAIGEWITAGTASHATIIGMGVDTSNRLVNNITQSLMIGFCSTIPTLFVGPSSGAGTIGKVGIGITNPGHLLQLAGGAYCDGTGTWVSGSDRAYKRDIKDLTKYGIQDVLKLRSVSYIHKQDKNNKVQIGLIAQEVKQVIPEVVDGEEGSMGLAYDRLVPVLVNAIKEQQKEIDDLKMEIEKLKK